MPFTAFTVVVPASPAGVEVIVTAEEEPATMAPAPSIRRTVIGDSVAPARALAATESMEPTLTLCAMGTESVAVLVLPEPVTVALVSSGEVATAARLTVTMHDRFWEWLYTPLTQVVSLVSGTLNHLQFLTIRRYLTLVFIALVALLLVLALWP